MKPQIVLLWVSCLVILAPSCKQNAPPSPLKFNAYPDNPVLSPGEPGSWDDLLVWVPQVVYNDNMFYLFYLGGSRKGGMAIGLATSRDGYHFTKMINNPIVAPDNEGFDAVTVGPGIVVKTDSLWVMYYNAQDIMAFAPGSAAGRATAKSPDGPWNKGEFPILVSGSKGEWDAGFIIPSSVFRSEDGGFIMYYSGGKDIASFDEFFIGLATSEDGLKWEKYNNPMTTQHPYAESDPVMMPGNNGGWDDGYLWLANVSKYAEGYRMYYGASKTNNREDLKAIGYATSPDGIHWKKYNGNPIYRSEDDPFILSQGRTGNLENPCLFFGDTINILYYECGPFNLESSFIGLAISP